MVCFKVEVPNKTLILTGEVTSCWNSNSFPLVLVLVFFLFCLVIESEVFHVTLPS